MTREEQDKRWAEHSKEVQQDIIERHNSYDISVPVLKALKDSLEYTYGKHNLRKLTYEDVARDLFGNYNEKQYGTFCCPVFSEEHCDKISAINSLICVARYLNKNEDRWGWINWDRVIEGEDEIFGIGIDYIVDEIRIFPVNPDRISTEIVYFRTEEIARKAIEILGEEVIQTALGNY